MLKYFKAFTRNKLDLVLVNFNTLVTLFFFLNIYIRINKKKKLNLKRRVYLI